MEKQGSHTDQALSFYRRNDMIVIAGGVIPLREYKFPDNKGGPAVFGAGPEISDAAYEIIRLIINGIK